jgi:hypothetical protein
MAVVALSVLTAESGVRLGMAQQPSQTAVQELLRRLEATENRLTHTEGRLRQTERELEVLRHAGGLSQERGSVHVHRLPTVHQPAGYFGPGEFKDDSGCCSDCGKSVCEGLPHLCGVCLEGLSWNKDCGWRIVPFGAATVETIYASDATTAVPFILFVNPKTADRKKRFTVTGQSTSLGFRVSGPPIGSFQTGALVLFDFHGDRPVLNEASPYFIRGYGEIYNENWRLAFGQNADIVAPMSPIALNWTAMAAAGNFGYGQRGQVRIDRYLYFGDAAQWTITGGLSQQVVPDFIDVANVSASDNGVPNFEGRIALGLGCEKAGQRPIEVGLSGVVGQLVDIDNFGPLVSDTWGAAVDLRVSGERIGVRGEFFSGEGIGTYNGAINQSLNSVTGLPIRTTGGWGQIWCKPVTCVTTAVGYGIDDPRNEDLADDQRSRNQVFFATLLWDVTDFFQVGLEYNRWETDYVAPSIDNQVDAVFSRITLKF